MRFDENGSIIVPENGYMTHMLSHDEKRESRQLPINIPTIIRQRKMIYPLGL